MCSDIYPDVEWERASPSEAGFDSTKLSDAKHCLVRKVGNGRCRVVIIRHGRLVAEWYHGFVTTIQLSPASTIKSVISRTLRATWARLFAARNGIPGRNTKLQLASIAKAIYSCILAVAVEEGKLPTADAKVINYYPEAMDVPEGEGPKAGRYAFKKDRDITFRQLISNSSGYMKPGEEPGKVFHQQTYGMSILAHAIAKIYGLYDINNPDGSPGLKPLIDEKLKTPIGATWNYDRSNFDLHPKARTHIFGFFEGIEATALDMARLGWLWCNWGRWGSRQLIPEAWMREATQTAPDIIANCSEHQWQYGYGFWTNDYLQLWPNLPCDSYSACGYGSQHIWVCPSLELVVVQSPGLWKDQKENDTGLLKSLVDACL